MSSKGFDKKRSLISSVSYFSKFSESKKDEIARLSNFHQYADNEIILHEGDDGSTLYILKSGTLIVKKQEIEFLRISNSGEMIGEGALLNGSKRQSTVVSSGITEMVSIDRDSLMQVFGGDYMKILLNAIVKYSLLADNSLTFLHKEDISKIIEKIEIKNFEDKAVVMPKDRIKTQYFYIICAGGIHSADNNHFIGPYQVIGLRNNNEKSLSSIDYLADGKTVIGITETEKIEKILKVKIDTLYDELEKIHFLKKIKIFQRLSTATIKYFSKKLSLSVYKEDKTIFKINDASDFLYIINYGTVQIIKSERILRILKKYEVFGERCIYEDSRTAEAVATEKTEVYCLHKEHLRKIKEYQILELELDRKKYYQNELKLDELWVKHDYPLINSRIRYCVKSKRYQLLYDLIIIPKHILLTKLACINLIIEKEVLLQLDYYLIVKLVNTACDVHNIYLFMEHVDGCPFREILPVSENYGKTLLVYLSSILEYLHDKNIVHRDFCTDNILISKKGLPYLINFNTSKILTDRTYTRVGNPYYRSPEMILGRGYTKSTDYWSLGVMLYEITYGYLPFDIKNSDPPVLAYEKILKVKHGTDKQKPELLNNMILNLLALDKDRYDISLIKSHP